MKFEDLLNEIKRNSINADFSLINKAYNFAEKAHFNQLRDSGEEHINHSLGASKVLVNLKVDDATIAACLLHDVLEDTNISKEKLKSEFGEEIANLVEGVTKISKITIPDFESRKAESLRKMLIASTKDIRIILIKLADRLDNMHTLKYLREDKQKRIAEETLEIYAPIAYRLGLANIKWQLEDLAFRYLNPEVYSEIKEKVNKKRNEREIIIRKVKNEVEDKLKKENINAEISGRVKSFYSIYKKITERNYSLESMYDLAALRILTNDVNECYGVLGIIHSLFKPIQERFKDYIANPKKNMYQSLHTVVLFNNEPVEFQITTRDMHGVNEEGIAAHWQYKKLQSDENFQKRLGWIKQILNIKSDNKDFLETLKIDLFQDHIFIFTPKHDIVEIPKDGTILDFAYAVHTDLGNKCNGARVNGKFVSLKHELNNGDLVEILTSKNQKPSREWLKYVKSQRSRSKIMQALKLHEIIPVSSLKKFERKDSNLIITEIKSSFIKLADCCNPLPNEEIIGLSTRNNKITIHQKTCTNISSKLKRINVSWNNELGTIVNIKIIADDRIGLFADILRSIASMHINTEKADAKSINKELAECNLKIKINSLQELIEVIDNIKKLKDIKKISLN